MPEKGDVYYFIGHQRDEDPDESDNKLFVFLNSSEGSNPYLTLKTTSQVQKYPGKCSGCNNRDIPYFYIPKSWKEVFDRDTIIKLRQIYQKTNDEILNRKKFVSMNYIGRLSENCIQKIIDCLKLQPKRHAKRFLKLL